MESETEADIEQTISYAKSLNAHQAQFSILTPYPGTADWDRNADWIYDNDWANYTGSKVVFHRDTLPAEVIENKLRKAYVSFYNPLRRWDLVLRNVAGVNPRKLWHIWRILRTQRDADIVSDADPVSNLVPLATESREDWLATRPGERLREVAVAS